MEATDLQTQARPSIKARLRTLFARIPMLGWLTGILCAVLIEHLLRRRRIVGRVRVAFH